MPLPEGQGEPFVQAVLDAIDAYLHRVLFTRIERIILTAPQNALWQAGLERLRPWVQLPPPETLETAVG
ncbi:MAG: hypothetical protein KatS3mg021_0664 [Fimbriimonadales bacterium]|nr:MAG: hypothetical protein KatS3mg021_0664 [Fimbriimonadales bacterium]